jgi:3-dehydro-L-gulonate 2-dehydrogenase
MTEKRIPYHQLFETFKTILLRVGFSDDRAGLSAELFAKANLDGVASHGLNRFPSFLKMIEQKYVHVDAIPHMLSKQGFFERWDGLSGPGNLNAHHAMGRAISLSKEYGIGLVALKNTNHWMRAGNYGWQAVEEDCIGLCFTNTKPNMPAWGGSEPILGNNPLVIAFPRNDGPIVLDMAMSQFSYGKMSSFLRENKEMPYEAGFDQSGKLTKEPKEIIDKELAIPIGLWKGAGLSLLLDLLASVLADGNATHDIGRLATEYNVSQIFISLNPVLLGIPEFPQDKVNEIINNFKTSATFESKEVRYPGEKTLETRQHNLSEGVPVDKDIWEQVLDILGKLKNPAI